jgi:putative NADH-flavin reductase
MDRSTATPTPSQRPLHVTILGGTGKTGRHVVDQALQAGHHVTVLARTPSKLDVAHERLRVVAGDVQDPVAVSEAIAGSSAVVSVLGPTQNTPDYQVSRGTAHVIEAMRTHGVRRLVVSAGAGVGGDGDQPKLVDHLISFVLKLAARHVLADMTRTVDAVRASGLDWTVVRVPMLTDGPPTGTIRVGLVGVNTGPRIARADMARFMLEQVHDASNVGASPVISN